MHYSRYLKQKLIDALKASPIVLLLGGRQTGKTTLMKEIVSQAGLNYVTFDDLIQLGAAQQDPIGFIENIPKPTIIDEVQRVPDIALPIKVNVDNNRTNGTFALTGSANPLVAPKLNDSLAGRMFILRMWPLSQAEIQRKKTTFIDMIFETQWKSHSYPACKKEELIQLCILGGYPTIQTLSETDRLIWFNSHLMTLLERDIQDLSQITRLHQLPRLLQLLAVRAAKPLNVSDVGRDVSLAYATLTHYLALLEALFLIFRIPSWHANATKRITKMPKLLFGDTGLLLYILGVNATQLGQNDVLFGNILENFAILEILKLLSFRAPEISLYYYHETGQVEVDIILENQQGQVIGIEIKSNSTPRPDDFKGLKAVAEECGTRFLRGILLYPGDQVVAFGKNLFAVPISSLWS